MELTKEHYERAAVAYNAYRKQAGGKSLVSGDKLPVFDGLRQEIKDAWAAAAIALSLEADRAIRSLKQRAEFGDQCYQDRCENAYVEQSVMKKTVTEAEEIIARRCAEIAFRLAAGPTVMAHRNGCHDVGVAISQEFGLKWTAIADSGSKTTL